MDFLRDAAVHLKYYTRIRTVHAAIVASFASACFGAFTPVAQAQDRVYWADYDGNAISSANVDGTGAGAHLNMNGVARPTGIAFDPARGRIYWSSWSTGQILGATLDDPSSATVLYSGLGEPFGVQIDAASQTLYWTDTVGSKVVAAPANGNGPLKTLFVDPTQPTGVSIDPAGGKIYWANFAEGFPLTGKISVGAIDGSGTATALYSALDGPSGIAIDPSTNTLWTTMQEEKTIKRSTLDGGPMNTIASSINSPDGVAADLNGGNIFWANNNPDTISRSTLTGADAITLNTSPISPNEPVEPVLLEDPNATSAPSISGTLALGSQLSCSQGGWANDLPGANLYQAAQSFAYQWQRNGTSVTGATSATFVPDQGGSYTCAVTATNYSGSTTQTTAAVSVPDAPTTSTSATATAALTPLTLGLQPPGLRHNACVTRTPGRKSFSISYSVSAASKIEAVLYFRKRSDDLRRSCKLGASSEERSKLTIARKWTFSAAAGNGQVKIPFKLDGKTLKVGRYTLNGVSIDGAGQRSKLAGTKFFIIPAK